MLRFITALFNDPLLLTFDQITLVITVILADHTLNGIIISIPDVIGSLWNFSWTFNVVSQKGKTIRAQRSLADFSVKLSIFFCAVLPLLKLLSLLLLAVYVLEIVIKKYLPSISFPLSHLAT